MGAGNLTHTNSTSVRRRRLVVGLIAGLILTGVIVAAMGLQRELKEAVATCIALLRSAGPWMFFGGMAILPAAGFPLAPFTVAAGPTFGPTMGATNAALCAVAAVTVNVTLSYAAARWWLRGPVERLLAWLGYRVPAAPPDAAWHLAFVVRLLPGPPFWVQSYALGLIRLPFAAYLVASVVVPSVYVVTVIFGGDALSRGERRSALLLFAGLGLFACVLGYIVRKRRSGGRVIRSALTADQKPDSRTA